MKNPLTYRVRRAINWLRRQPAVKELRRRYPHVFQVAVDRFSTREFVGLPLTLVFLVAAINILLLSELTESVMQAAWVVSVDKQFTAFLYSMRSERLSLFFYTITQLADQQAALLVGGLATIVLLYQKRYVALLAFWLTLAGVGLSVRFGKTIISRARPVDVAYYAVEHFSFPSGHATTAIMLYGLLAYFAYGRYSWHPMFRTLIPWVAAILILLIGFSRIYLGVHYLSDVLAGFLLGGLWLLVGISLTEVVMLRKERRAARSKA
ncbi:undecaprenyl-diphosphatase [Pontibacter ummariensis]|uniref:Undecaprenyl-diphosphatase n=1 Tax=Pontibacter ummariensis TaxID=1610492 RepID=A0A239KC81_9BACT|nr:phosphatase PAP2 family protein [Pontibacter ummariensis]PRY06061.1 undecaprenyl-diphosphatase [Pontibacter ummariensis]SNT14724.1 undecaprenyl-diphosphatase [Pontibacter ummariensis]